MVPKPDKADAPIVLSSDRLASLSDTMFGVAMTLVVTTLLPSIQAHRGPVLDLLPALKEELTTVLLSFIISARYWVFQQQRLAMARTVTAAQIRLHLAFLFLIVLVPVSTSLDGLTGSGARLSSVMIYGAHLFLIALVNTLLWHNVHRTVGAHRQIVRSCLSTGLLVAALAVGALRPDLALYLWVAVLAIPLPARYLTRRLYGI
jgi:uncharacterized membrane protein